MSGSWLLGWADNDLVTAAEFGKSMGSFYDSTLGTSSGTFNIATVPSWGSHLLFVLSVRSTEAVNTTGVYASFNGNSGATAYAYLYTQTSGTTISAATVSGTTQALISVCPGNNALFDQFSAARFMVPNFRGTSNQKQMLGEAAAIGGAYFQSTHAGIWLNDAAITRVTLSAANSNFFTGSRLTGYVLGP